MSFSSKRNISKNQKERDSLHTAGDTFFDSLHNSKISEDTNKKKVFITNKKENNFYLALMCMRGPDSDTLLLGTSEFSENNPNQTKEENISRYLHHPIVKEINKEGNKLVRIKPKQNYDSIVNHPYISKYNNMKNIFKDLLISVKELEDNKNIDNKNINNLNINELEINHKKNNSSISNNIYRNYTNYNNNALLGIKSNNNTYKNQKVNNNKSNHITSTTVTKEKNKNKNNFGDVQDIKKQINYDKLEDLEEPKDIDIKNYIINEEENNNINNNILLNDYTNNILPIEYNKNIVDKNNLKIIQKNSISTKKDEILVIDSFNEGDNNNQNTNLINKKEEKMTTIKKLRKKYERTEFKKYIYNTNPMINRYLYENQDINKDLIMKKDRKKTEELNNNKNYNDNIYIKKQKINISAKNFSELEDSLSQLSNNINNKININKNSLDNFNNCGNIKNNEFLMRHHNQNNMNNNNNDNQNKNMNNFELLNKNESRLSTPAELLDFISNKSDNNLNNNNTNNHDIQNNKNNYNYNVSYSNNNTFVIKNIENKFDICSDICNSNICYEFNRSAKSEYKVNYMQNNIFSQVQSQNEIYEISSSNKNVIEENTDNFYDFVTPDKNPEATIRRNFSLNSPFYYKNSNINSKSNELNYKCHSCNIKMNRNCIKKDFSILSNRSINDNQNSIKSKNIISKNKNNFYLVENEDKIRKSYNRPQPETIYDLTFYKNLIKNKEKIKKINYKNILKNQKKLKWEDRLHTLAWMMQICEEFAFKRDTFHYACNYFDNYLTFGNERIKNKKILQLIGITCISISGKIEEVQIPKLKEYSNSIDESFEIKDIIDMEQKLCSSLGWKLINVNINTWLNWYTCQWDLYIDSVDDIKSQLLKFIKEEDIIYYKKSNDNSYYNLRKLCQLVDLIILDYYSYNFESRILMAVSLFTIICINYKFDYNFNKRNFRQQTEFSDYIFYVYIQFLNQSFDYNFDDDNFQKALAYCYQFKNFNFTYDLPLLYQIHQELLENGNYEDFVSYQTTNDNIELFLKDIIIKRNKKSSSEKTTSNTDKNKFSSKKKTNK